MHPYSAGMATQVLRNREECVSMEQPIPSWLSAAVNAAGMATVYNADDWSRMVDEQIKRNADHTDLQLPPISH